MKNPDYAIAFKSAIPFLAISLSDKTGKKTEFICNAIERAAWNCLISPEQMDHAKDLILDRMRRSSKSGMRHTTFNSWVIEMLGHATIEADRVENDCRKMQEARLAWLNSLVAEFS